MEEDAEVNVATAADGASCIQPEPPDSVESRRHKQLQHDLKTRGVWPLPPTRGRPVLEDPVLAIVESISGPYSTLVDRKRGVHKEKRNLILKEVTSMQNFLQLSNASCWRGSSTSANFCGITCGKKIASPMDRSSVCARR